MWGLLKRLSAECWGRHDWIYKANTRGLWLECRRCGQESPGLELAAPRYRQTQHGIEEAHRLGTAPTLRVVDPPADETASPRRFERRRAAHRTTPDRPALVEAATQAAERLSEAERRWLQAWRTLTPDERVLAERLLEGLQLTKCSTRHFTPRERPAPVDTPGAADTHGRMAG